jgi:hypothetical protein
MTVAYLTGRSCCPGPARTAAGRSRGEDCVKGSSETRGGPGARPIPKNAAEERSDHSQAQRNRNRDRLRESNRPPKTGKTRRIAPKTRSLKSNKATGEHGGSERLGGACCSSNHRHIRRISMGSTADKIKGLTNKAVGKAKQAAGLVLVGQAKGQKRGSGRTTRRR